MELTTFIEQFREPIEGLEDTPLDGTTEFQKLPVWDSLAMLLTVAMVESEYGVRLRGAEIEQCPTLADLAALVDERRT